MNENTGGTLEEDTIVVEGAIKSSLTQCRSRLVFAGAFFLVSYLIVGARLFEISSLDVENIKKITMPKIATSYTKRNDIVDRNNVLLSTNLRTKSLFANPEKILDAEEAAEQLSGFFTDLSYETIYSNLTAKKKFVWIKRNLPPKEYEIVNDMGIPGLYFRQEEKRVYPHSNLASHTVGFVGTEKNGLSGVEKYFNSVLVRDSNSSDPLELSLDVRVQDILHKELLKAVTRFKAIGAAGVVMDVNSGEVVAMVSLPDFDPNNPAKMSRNSTFNRATYGVYEMGSVFKAFTMAGAIDEGVIKLSDKFDARKPLRFAGHTIRDHHAKNKWLNVPEILMYSSNIGMAKIAQEMGVDTQRKFLSKLNLLDRTDIEIGEITSPIYPNTWGTIHSMTISYGHGVAVTPIHVVSAMSSVVNGGIYYKPTLLRRHEKIEGDRIMKQGTSDIMRKLLREVVKSGTGGFADVEGYIVGGKTGTAEKLVNGKYDKKAKLSSFLAAFPMHKPEYSIFVMIDEPHGDKETFGIATGGFTAAPVVSKVISKIGPLLGIMPVDEEAPEIRRALKIEDRSGRKDIAAK